MYSEVAENVYEIPLHGPVETARAHLLDWPDPVLVDAGAEATVDTLVSALEQIGTDPEHLVITHGDFDHIGGFDTIVEEFAPETWVPAETTIDAETSGVYEAALAHTPDHRFEHGAQVGPFDAVHVPGHAPDNYAFVAEQHDLAALGDVLVGSDRRGLPAGYFVLPEGIHSLDLIEAEQYLERLVDYEFDIGLLTHGSSVFSDASDKLERFVEFPDKPDWSESRRTRTGY